MMGLYPQQTVFVATNDHVSAVTLLNHFTRYRLATNGVAQVTANRTAERLYLLDQEPGGTHRLRLFDVPTGQQRAERAAIEAVANDERALSTAIDGRVLVLKSDARHAWVEAYERLSLEPLGTVMEAAGCGDRLLTSGTRVAVVCLSNGEITLDNLRGDHVALEERLPNLAAAAMAEDGTLFVAAANRRLGTVGPRATKLSELKWPSEWSGTVLPDGLAVAQDGETVVIAQASDDVAWLRLFEMTDLAHRRSLRLAGAPRGGVLAMWPFAYYTLDATVRHVDLTSGLLETMAEVGAGAIPGAVVNG
jgi:hypothetical protein